MLANTIVYPCTVVIILVHTDFTDVTVMITWVHLSHACHAQLIDLHCFGKLRITV